MERGNAFAGGEIRICSVLKEKFDHLWVAATNTRPSAGFNSVYQGCYLKGVFLAKIRECYIQVYALAYFLADSSRVPLPDGNHELRLDLSGDAGDRTELSTPLLSL